ncbi:MAG TPA: orotidine-5'-phosphate decarboxylase [Acidimicrobiales bacterium]|nr:orotidine-5'-phosphate decarboxylase [Acidimicrobiales bacterium]
MTRRDDGRGRGGRPERELLALALDLDDLDSARSLARRLAPWFAVAKVGLELFSAAGAGAVHALASEGFSVFLDVKLHDIPETVGRASRVLGRTGVRFVTLHASGGEAMLAAGVAGLRAGAAEADVPEPCALAVTVLTSDTHAPEGLLAARASAARDSGCGGVVCAATDLAVVRAAAPGLLAVVPGTRPAGAPAHDQARVATPADALAAGAGLLVVGRVVTRAGDPERAAEELVASLGPAS